MEVLFIRHGQPEWVRDGLAVDDPPLTQLGRRQARQVGEYLRHIPFDELFVSPLVRARETAAPLAEAVGVEPTVLPWLAEIAAPRWEGTPADVVEQAFAESRHRPLDEQWDGLPGGESFRAFHVRVTTGLRAMLDDEGAVQTADDPPLWKMTEPHRRLVIVAHSGTNATALGHLLGIPPVPWEWERFVTLHASVSQVEPIAIGGGHAFSLSRLSAVDHLPETDRTR